MKEVEDVAVFTQNILKEAHARKASDIHIDPTIDSILIRFRIDGVLREVYKVKSRNISEIVGHIKILSGLRIDVHDRAQDGRLFLLVGETQIDVRVSIVPTFYGENIVFRILDQQVNKDLSFDDLGIDESQQSVINEKVFKSQGLILVAGPTGSGKTTTLYSFIQKIAKRDLCVITLEDPIEYSIPGIRQVHVRQERGFTFANALKSILRQDPDVVMVGEIRDKETAQIVIHTALTGHLVLSTIHASSASAVILRLSEMGLEPYLVAATLSLVISQRLARKIAESGGYAGRLGIFEVVGINEKLRELIIKNVSSDDLKREIERQGILSLLQDGIKKVDQGKTSLEELKRVLYE
ncbi:MAG: type 4 fimbrial assembly protein PilB, type pilus assembly protein PilB [Candidatus Parcubacteria bacterium]|jgi:type II secretory ATPase GspE/PulE/Tfp pilus assembly ATPase PilB-like protein